MAAVESLEVVMRRVRSAGWMFQIQTCSDGGYAAVVGEYGSGYRSHREPTDALLAAFEHAKEALAQEQERQGA